MQLIHITTQREYNVLVNVMELKGFKPYRSATINGDRYVANEDGFLAYFLSDAKVKEIGIDIIEFEDFLKEAI